MCLWAQGKGCPEPDKRQLLLQGLHMHGSPVREALKRRKEKGKSKPVTAFRKTSIWKLCCCHTQRNQLHSLCTSQGNRPLSVDPLPLQPRLGVGAGSVATASRWLGKVRWGGREKIKFSLIHPCPHPHPHQHPPADNRLRLTGKDVLHWTRLEF